MTAPKPLSARNAEISTATVEIRTMTVSRKQMTLAVFRQLIEEPLIDDDGKLAGIPWGSVNFHPGECKEPCKSGWSYKKNRTAPGSTCRMHGEHRHMVWQRGDELRRGIAWERDWCPNRFDSFWTDPDNRRYCGEPVNRLAQAAFCMSGHTGLPDWMTSRQDPYLPYATAVFTCDGVVCAADSKPDAPVTWESPYKPHQHPCLTAADFQAAGAALEAGVAEVNAKADAELARRGVYTTTWRGLTDLPQLFIAVLRRPHLPVSHCLHRSC